MPRIDETASVLWATPNTMDSLPSRSYEAMKAQATHGGRKNRSRPGNLREQIDPLMQMAYDEARSEANNLMWSTPTACEWKGRGPNSKQQGLAEEVQLWVGTPTAQMSSQGRSEKFRKGRTPNPVEFAQMFPTPRANESGDYCYSRGDHSKPTPTLSGAVRMWPTPREFCYKDSKYDRGKSNLGEVVFSQMYPTPTTGAPLCGGSGNYEQLKRLVDNGTITEYEKRQMSQQGGGQLNPDWVEWLMGVPQGWTDRDKDISLPEYDPHWYDAEPPIPRVATGIENRVDRLKSLGNMVDPYQFLPVMECIAEILRGGRE